MRLAEFPATVFNLVHATERIVLRRKLLVHAPAALNQPTAPPVIRSHDHGMTVDIQQIVDARLRGDTLAEIGKRLGICAGSVRRRIANSTIDDVLKQKVLGSVRMLAEAAGKPSPHTNANADAKGRLLKIIEMRKQGMTLEEVGKQFDLTRERVRQIIARAPTDLRATAPRRVRIAEPKPFWHIQEIRKHHGSFRKLAIRWLLLIDHAYCALGHHAVPLDAMSGHSASTVHARCTACNNARQSARYHAPDGRLIAYTKKYRAAHPEMQARATLAYQQRNPDKMKERNRKSWQKIKTDPAKLAAYNAKMREKAALRRNRAQ